MVQDGTNGSRTFLTGTPPKHFASIGPTANLNCDMLDFCGLVKMVSLAPNNMVWNLRSELQQREVPFPL